MDASSRGGVASQVEASIWEAFRQYLEGMDRWYKREPIEACENEHQRRGWRDAERAATECWGSASLEEIGYYESRYPWMF